MTDQPTTSAAADLEPLTPADIRRGLREHPLRPEEVAELCNHHAAYSVLLEAMSEAGTEAFADLAIADQIARGELDKCPDIAAAVRSNEGERDKDRQREGRAQFDVAGLVHDAIYLTSLTTVTLGERMAAHAGNREALENLVGEAKRLRLSLHGQLGEIERALGVADRVEADRRGRLLGVR